MSRIAKCALTVWALSAACGMAMGEVVGTESFETGMGAWTKDSAATGTAPFVAGATREASEARTGRWAVTLSASGGSSNGAVWLERSIRQLPGTYDVKMTFWVRSPTATSGGAANVIATMGTKDPEKTTDMGPVGRAGVAAGWRMYELSKSVTIGRDEPLWVAVGFGLTSGVNQRYVFDDVAVQVTPQICRADFDRSGAVSSADLFMFLDKWFVGTPECDFNASGAIDHQDIFDFLNTWFAGCGPNV